ncbi:MAG TPA: heparan-alpha-glucosaminide N-acetyltransferase domain-containing protein [Kofleriaceae bacterium]|nr:heparan-alpha-glucosaminide N-acetyltransferase domain-containing protein [Kofleriaceae bacterium]
MEGREPSRLPAIDLVRGIVMVLMTLDHSSSSFNAKRTLADGAAMFAPDTVLEPLQFITRWVTHLCAPTFVMLAGLSLAISVARRRRAGVHGSVIDRDILIRGALLIVIDAAWMGWIWRLGLPILQLGVLYAIGMAMIGMIALRRLPPAVVGAIGLAILVLGEVVLSRIDPSTTLAAATLVGGQVGSIYWLYPFLPWAGFLLVGWALGSRIAEGAAPGGLGMRARDWWALAALAALVFVVVRGLNAYGNEGLFRRDGGWDAAWIEWLHVSKYPPSLSYAALELGIAFALLGALWHVRPRPLGPLMVFGQTALFFYLFHVHILKGVAVALGIYKTEGLGTVYVGWVALLVLLYPACRWYLGVKRRHPDSVLRFV